MGYPAPGRRTLGRVARAAEDRGVGDVERRTASGERDDVIDGQVCGGVGGAGVARAPVAVLASPGAEHAGAEPVPGPRAVESVVPAPVGRPCVDGAAATTAAGRDAAHRAELHWSGRLSAARPVNLVTPGCTPFDIASSVSEAAAVVYSSVVLHPRGQSRERGIAGLHSALGQRQGPSLPGSMEPPGRSSCVCAAAGCARHGLHDSGAESPRSSETPCSTSRSSHRSIAMPHLRGAYGETPPDTGRGRPVTQQYASMTSAQTTSSSSIVRGV